LHQKVPAIRRWNNLVDEKTVAIRERDVERALNLPAELPGLPFGLTVRRIENL
jgi:hypothetical protein